MGDVGFILDESGDKALATGRSVVLTLEGPGKLRF